MEIVDDKGLVVGTTALIILAPGAMIVSTVTVSPTVGGTAGTAAQPSIDVTSIAATAR